MWSYDTSIFSTVATNNSFLLEVPPHPGSDVMYMWDFGDGANVTTENASVAHTWSEAGVYTVTLLAFSNISSMEVNVSSRGRLQYTST